MLDIVQKFLCFVSLVTMFFLTTPYIGFVGSPFQEDSATALVLSPDIDTNWRYTREGWQDSTHWSAEDAFVPAQFAELVHPLVWTVLILLAVVTIMIWASSEKEVARLLGDDDRGSTPKSPAES